MVLEYHGVSLPSARIRRLLRSTEQGAAPIHLPELAKVGMSVHYAFASSETPLLRALHDGIPPICLVDTGGLPHWAESVQHAVVVVDFNDGGFQVNDPAYADRRWWVPHDAFMLAWSDMDYQYALIQPID